jgi:hypothetical protein
VERSIGHGVGAGEEHRHGHQPGGDMGEFNHDASIKTACGEIIVDPIGMMELEILVHKGYLLINFNK